MMMRAIKSLCMQTVVALLVLSSSCVATVSNSLFNFVGSPLSGGRVITDPLVLRDAACDALLFFNKNRKIVHSPILSSIGVGVDEAEKTLRWIVKIVGEDESKGKYRISDPAFLNKHFSFVKWSGDVAGAKRDNVVIPRGLDGGKLKDGRIKITSYAVFAVDGSHRKTSKFDVALYGYNRHQSSAEKRGKSKVLLNENGRGLRVHPLVWLCKKDAADALMQGSLIVHMPDGKRRVFHVHESREVASCRGGKRETRWFFREILNIKKTPRERLLRIIDHPWAVFAGDLRNLGLGKVIALKYRNPTKRRDEIRLGVLTDTGEAFQNNLYQLDLYAGIYDSRCEFKNHLKQLPNTSYAYILVKK